MLNDNKFLIAIAILILLVLCVLAFVLYLATRGVNAKVGSDPKLVKLRFDSLRQSFRQAVELIESNIAARSERYGIPWVLVLNEGAQSGGLPIQQSGLPSALSSEAASAATTPGISWNFFDKGVVVEMQGAYLGSPDDENAAEKPWDEFLGLCRNYRPQRPFDSVVITVPAQMLMDNGPDAALELSKLARAAHRRLWLAQNRFAMRFAVYIAVSGCETVAGFSAFARALPESMRASMLGWSSPYDLSTTYQESWISEAMQSVVRTISDTAAEISVSSQAGADTASFFLLPSRLDALRTPLQAYANELMRPSAYHEPFFLRGVYFTGDSSLAAQTIGHAAEANGADLLDEIPKSGDVVSQLMQEPAFLRDLFEKKIFLEYGLARPSRQMLARPVLTRVARWGAVIVLGGWGLSLAVATFELNRRNPVIAKTLRQIEADTRYRVQMASRGETIAADWYKSRTLLLLGAIENLGADKAWTLVMPGAWSYWDDLEARVVDRVEREFGEIAIGTLRRELYARASALTGVAQDESTSELIIGGECSAPPIAKTTNSKASLAIEDTAEFSAILQYLTMVGRLDEAILAMQRLQKTDSNEANDLRLLVKYTLGAELPGNISKSLRLFRGREAGAIGSAPTLSVIHMQQAAQCSLFKGLDALNQRIFVNNDLLVTERQLAALTTRLLSADSRATGYAPTVDGFKEILTILRDQDNLLATGRGGWMHQSTPKLGPTYDTAMVRVSESIRLLGPDVSAQVSQRTNSEFLKFNTEFLSRFNAELQSGIEWQEKDSRFVLSPARVALRDAITALLAQPFMTVTADREIPEIPARGFLTWDSLKLDQAAALEDVYKRFINESLVKFPVATRASVVAFLNAQFARLVNDRVVEAFSVSGRSESSASMDSASFDAARGRLLKVQGFLVELGAREIADQLQRLVSQDASARLRQIDRNLNQFDLYSFKGRDFSYWSGERGPVLQAFGVADSQALMQYLSQQYSQAESLGRQSEIYLSSLDRTSADGQLAQRWNAINRELERYRQKNPNSSLIGYEQFLTTVGVDIDRNTCTEKLVGKAPASRPADYFGERHLNVYSALLKRCQELRLSEQQEMWASFSSNFNRLIAGRQPFALAGSKDSLDADYEDLGQLFKASEKINRLLKESPTGARIYAPSAAVRKFSDQYERVRSFMAPLFPTDDGVVAGYDVAVDFRANQAAEVDGNKVIDWVLEIGPQSLRLRDAPRPLRWEPGMPVTLTLRLAKDVPGRTFTDPQQLAMSADGKTVVYRYTNTWSLLSMIQNQREGNASGRADDRTQLLRMEFPIGTGAELGKGAQPDVRAKVYIRLAISAVGKRTPLAWPVTFPIRAPEYTTP
jgi:type VI secretion system protein ImpL